MTQIPLPETASADRPEADKLRDDKTRQVTPDLGYRQIAIVNVVFFGEPGAGDGNWTLVDPGTPGSARPPISRAGAVWRNWPARCNRVDTRAFRPRSVPSKRWPRTGIFRFMRISWSIPI
jgi:hypothetical protein